LDEPERIAKVLMFRSAYSYFLSKFEDAIEQAGRAEQIAEDLVTTDLGLYTQVVWFMSLLYLGRVDEAMQRAVHALQHSRTAGNRKEEGRILTGTGLVVLQSREPADAFAYLHDAVEIAHEVRDPALQARALNNLALAEASVNGNFARAQECYEQAYSLHHQVGDRHNESVALSSLGYAAAMQGNFDTARSYHEQSLRIAREVGSLSNEAFALINLSSVSGIQNQAELALQQAAQATELSRRIAHPSFEAWGLLYMGHAYLLLGQFEESLQAYRGSLEIRIALNQPSMSMEPIAGLVEAYLRMDDLEKAAAEAEKILKHLDSGFGLGGTEEPLRIYHACYLVLKKKGDPREQAVLDAANQILASQASKLADEAARQRYVENIPWRRAVRDAAQLQQG